MKKSVFLFFLLTILSLSLLSACGSDPSLLGKWETEIDYSSLLSDEDKADLEMLGGDSDNFKITLSFEFFEKDTASLSYEHPTFGKQSFSGSYTAENKKLSFSIESEKADTSKYIEYKIEGDKLTFVSSNFGEDDFAKALGLEYPLTFVKVN